MTLVAGEQRVTWDDNRIRGHAGLCFQAVALARYVTEGRTESPLHPLDETVAILQTADEVRRQVGAIFPGEQPRRRRSSPGTARGGTTTTATATGRDR